MKKIKTQKELDKYLAKNQKEMEREHLTLEQLRDIVKEQNEVLTEWVKFKCQE